MESPEKWHLAYFNDEMGAVIGRAIADSERGRVRGRHLFENGTGQTPLELVESETFITGVLNLTYRPATS
jgi:hypothetical protein